MRSLTKEKSDEFSEITRKWMDSVTIAKEKEAPFSHSNLGTVLAERTDATMTLLGFLAARIITLVENGVRFYVHYWKRWEWRSYVRRSSSNFAGPGDLS